MTQQTPEEPQFQTNPGELLKLARVKAEFSPAEVALRMNLAVEIIETIDEDQYAKTISPAFYRGYLRTYAHIVGIDADETIDLYNNRIHQDSLSANITPTFDTNLYTKKDRHYPYFKWFIYFISMLIVVFAGYYVWSKKSQPKPQQNEIQLRTPDTQDSSNIPLTGLNDGIEGDSETSSQQSEATHLNNIETNHDQASTTIKQDNSVVESTKNIQTNALVNPESAILEMTFIGDCWVKVVSADGEVLALGIKRSGKKMSLSGMAPFNIILGNAAVVSIEYNQRVVDLSGYPAGNRVEFELSAKSELLQ